MVDRIWYRLGGGAALLTVVVGIVEVLLTFLPYGDGVGIVTPADWFMLIEAHPFMALRNLGLLNIALNLLGMVAFVSLYRVLQKPGALLAMITYLVGAATFFATNRAFAMWALSQQAASASRDAAGQAMLAVGQSHTPGTLIAFLLVEVAVIVMALQMLQASQFNRAACWIAVAGFSLLIGHEIRFCCKKPGKIQLGKKRLKSRFQLTRLNQTAPQ